LKKHEEEQHEEEKYEERYDSQKIDRIFQPDDRFGPSGGDRRGADFHHNENGGCFDDNDQAGTRKGITS
jgi:hypothetical protein